MYFIPKATLKSGSCIENVRKEHVLCCTFLHHWAPVYICCRSTPLHHKAEWSSCSLGPNLMQQWSLIPDHLLSVVCFYSQEICVVFLFPSKILSRALVNKTVAYFALDSNFVCYRGFFLSSIPELVTLPLCGSLARACQQCRWRSERVCLRLLPFSPTSYSFCLCFL